MGNYSTTRLSRRFILGALFGLAAVPAMAQGLGFGLGMHDVVAQAGGGRSADAIMADATLDYNFAAGTYRQTGVPACTSITTCVTTTRTMAGAGALATNLLYTSASGFAYATYPVDVPRVVSASGILAEPQAVNRLVNSAAPATQTTASLVAATYTLWVNGGGSAQATAGTAIGTGFGGTPASQGAPKNFTISTAGTVTVTVTGSLNAFQLEQNSYPSSFISTAAVAGTRGAEILTVTSPPTIGAAYSFNCQGVNLVPFPPPGSQTLGSISDGTTANHILCRRNITTGKAVVQSNAFGFTDAGAAILEGGSVKMVSAFGPGEAAAAFSSGDIQSSGGLTLPTGMNAIKIGVQGNNAVQWGGYVSRISFWPTRLSNAELLKVAQ